jgi:hypothetical protein
MYITYFSKHIRHNVYVMYFNKHISHNEYVMCFSGHIGLNISAIDSDVLHAVINFTTGPVAFITNIAHKF